MEKFYYLSDIEKALVKTFYENEAMREAIKKVLLHGLYKAGILEPDIKANGNQNWAYSLPWKQNPDGSISSDPVSNEQLGAEVRAICEGLRNVETVFQNQLPMFAGKVVNPGPKRNPAR